ncbi:MAG: translation initiation factor IF-3 [Bdellovibrionales bacterium]
MVRTPASGAPNDRRNKQDGPRINGAIQAKEIRVIDETGEMRGVMSVRDAQKLADQAGLDLVEISPNIEPPVCKILDFGKYKFELKKKASEARKKQKTVELKEIKLRPNIEDHDFNIKMKSAFSFLEDGDKVKVTLRFRGREMAHQDIAKAVMNRAREALEPVSKVTSDPSFEGRQMVMILSPNK